ncbi:MAG: carbon-nitrogen hydrolase family protein [Clostridia bacterium]|nr:carbon-nitrogen hydrolase family protein [Clostridia bacterium]
MKTKIVCCQMQSGLGTKQKNVEKMVKKIEEVAGNNDVDLIIFPELATTGYECSELYDQLAETYPEGESIKKIAAEAKKYKVHIVFGFVESAKKEDRPVLYNAAVLIDDEGKPLGCYRKSHLVDGEETKYFEKGTDYNVFETKIGKIGIMICWDMAYPEVARILALKGAEIIAVPAAWETEPNKGDWEIVNAARSFDNVVYLASCNHVGTDKELNFFGRSKISGPLGRPLATGNDGEETIKATVDLAQLPELREGYYVLLKDRNPETYEEIIKPK